VTTRSIRIAGSTDHIGLRRLLQRAGALTDDWDELEIRVQPGAFLSQGALALLAAWGQLQLERRRHLRFIGQDRSLDYLARMNVLEILDWPYAEGFRRHPEEGRFISMRLIHSDDDVGPAASAVCEFILRTFENARDLLPAFEWTVDELLGNIPLHAQAEVPGVLCGQYYPNAGRLDIAVCDAGRGIRAAISEAYDVTSDAEAIELAIQPGVTRNTAEGQGNGLAGAVEIARRNEGSLRLWSGETEYHVTGAADGTLEVPAMEGTGLLVSLNPERPVDLSETFLANTWSGWTYLDFVTRELESTGAIVVANECLNTGSRGPARALRLKISALLPDMEGVLRIDFAGVEFAASSFLDELLGRLIDELGVTQFQRRVAVVNATPLISRLANAVMSQRLAGR